MEEVTEMNTDNVLFMRAKSPIFSQELKEKMVITLGTEDARQTVESLEHVICSHIVLKMKELGTNIGKMIGEKISLALRLKDE